MAGLAIVQASSDAWPEAGAQAERALNTGWILDQSLTSTGGFTTAAAPSTATAFFSTGDGTTGSGNGFYALRRKVRVVHAGGSAYARVASAAYSTTLLQTTVGLTDWQSGTTSLSTAAITTVAVAPVYFGSSGDAPHEAGLRNTGDMLYRDSTGVTRLVVGSSAQALFGGTVPQWAALPSPSLSYVEAALGGNVTMTNANQYYDGPSVGLTAGTWLLVGTVTLTGPDNTTAKLWDGTTVEASAETVIDGAISQEGSLSLSGIVVLGSTTTMKISVAGDRAGGTILAAAPDNGAGNNASHLRAVKIA